MIVRADAARIPLAAGTVDCVVTSPPYLAQRLYGGSPLEGGQQRTLAAYVSWLGDVFDEVRRVLRPEGFAWLNIGDKSNGSGGGGGDWRPTGASERAAKAAMEATWKERTAALGAPRMFRDPAYSTACFLDVPGAVARELTLRGWRLRMPIVWNKGVEERARLGYINRPRWQHEIILMLSPAARHVKPRFWPSQLVETGSVWTFAPGGSGPAHLAPFPDELVRRCLLPSTLPGDLVLDPFSGSGTTVRVATAMGRRAVGLDLYAGAEP